MVMPATTVNNVNNKVFSFIKDDVKRNKKVELQKEKDKHGSLICLKNISKEANTSQSSKSRKP